MKNLLAFLHIATAFIYNLISVLFTCLAWIFKAVGLFLVTGSDAILDLLNQLGNGVYANQINNGANTNRPK
jgi:hypothetical protein